MPNLAGLVAVFLRPLTNGITLASLVYSASVGVGKLVNMGGYQVVNGLCTLHNVLENMNSKRKLVSKDLVQMRATALTSDFGGSYHKLFTKPNT